MQDTIIHFFFNNRFYYEQSVFFEIYDSEANEISTKYIDEDYMISDDYSTSRKFKNDYLNFFIIGDNNFFYIMPNQRINQLSKSYYIIKLDSDLKLIGKRRIDLNQKYDENRCTSSIYVDNEGYIYVASDKEMTITKFKPIKDGEDSHIDLSN